MKVLVYIATLFILAQIPIQSIAQDASASTAKNTKFNREKWNELRGKLKYRKAPTATASESNSGSGSGEIGTGRGNGNGRSGIRKYLKRKKEKKEEKSSSGRSSPVAQVIMIILAIFLIGLILYQLLFKNSSKTKLNTEIEEEIEEFDINTIQKTDLEIALEKALSEENYRKCVRIYFTFILKELSEKGLIYWERDKTNYDYLRELKSQKEYHDFRNIVDIFDIIWYGKREIDASVFAQIEPIFKNFLNQVSQE